MAADNIVAIVKALGEADNLEIFEMVSKGEVCGCKIGERFGLDKEGVGKKMSSLVISGLVEVVIGDDWDHYKLEETQMCLLNKYFNDRINECRATGCKCKCKDGCC